MKSRKTVKLILGWLLLAVIALTLVFIFSNSLKSSTDSADDSGAVGDFVAGIIPPDTELGEFVQDNIRKTAHFAEFAVLGAEVAVLVWLYFRRYRVLAMSLSPLFGLLVAVVDETLQYIPKDRGPSVLDVWIDVGGYATALVPVFLVFILVTVIMNRVRAKRKSENG